MARPQPYHPDALSFRDGSGPRIRSQFDDQCADIELREILLILCGAVSGL